jgi:hypothetical protein
MAILPKAICRFSAISIKIPTAFFIDTEKSNVNFTWKHKRPQTVKAILNKTENLEVKKFFTSRKSRGISILDFKLY